MAIVVHLYHIKTPFPIVSLAVGNGKSTGYDVMKTWGRLFLPLCFQPWMLRVQTFIYGCLYLFEYQ